MTRSKSTKAKASTSKKTTSPAKLKTAKSKRTSQTSTPKNANANIILPEFGLAEEILEAIKQQTLDTEDTPQELEKASSSSPLNHHKKKSDDKENDSQNHPSDNSSEAPEDDHEQEKTIQYVVFELDDEVFALPIEQVREINRVSHITRVPNASIYILGVINLRGRVVPVVDLKKRLKIGDSLFTNDSRIIIVEYGTRTIGLLVDKVAHVISMCDTEIEPAIEEVFDTDNKFIKGVGKQNSDMLVIIDLENVIQIQYT